MTDLHVIESPYEMATTMIRTVQVDLAPILREGEEVGTSGQSARLVNLMTGTVHLPEEAGSPLTEEPSVDGSTLVQKVNGSLMTKGAAYDLYLSFIPSSGEVETVLLRIHMVA